MMRRFCASLIVAAAVAASLLPGQAAAAGPPRLTPPDLVALGDSFAAGTGNTPYVDDECGRSAKAAYSERLDQLRLVTLQAFPACGGDTTVEVAGQVDAITEATDLVTVQALGNDYHFGELARLCIGADCSPGQEFGPGTVGDLLASIPLTAPDKLDALFKVISDRIATVHSKARVIVVDYGDPFPDPAGYVGPFCPYMSAAELGVARDFAGALNKALKESATRWQFAFADAAPRFRGLDICGFSPAFFRPALPEPYRQLPGASGDPRGALHPNKLGQGIYAAVAAGRLYR